MLVETFAVGMLSTNCYVVSSQQTKDAIIIDPGLELSSEAQQIFEYIRKDKLDAKLIVNTHSHQDHTSGNSIIKKKYDIPVYIHKNDADSLESFEDSRFASFR